MSMPETRRGLALRSAAVALLTLVSTAGGPVAARAQALPTDPKTSCTVPTSTFDSWFQSGTPAKNGVVNPANSVAFPGTPNCSFYQWSKQMFLWLTSPSPPVYGTGANIFDSPAFFDVSPPDAQGHRTFLPHTPNFIRRLGVRAAQVGPHGLPIIFDTAGRMLEVERPQIALNSQLTIVDTAGKRVQVARAERDTNGRLVLRDAAGATIERGAAVNARPVFRAPAANTPLMVQKLIVNNIPIFIDPSGNVVETEEGQADFSVLRAGNGSLVYYVTMVNDVYAYFLTGLANNVIEPGNPNPTFPTTLADLNVITAYAASHSVTFPDPDALAVELKTSWVEAAGLPNAASYITMTATIPTYDTASGTTWTQNGEKTVQLALVGLHLVGSAAGHPEMIWATFEHVGNTPLAAYQYINSTGTVISVPQTTAGTWVFSASGSSGPFNQAHMSETSGTTTIVAVSPFTISASDTIRRKPFGAASDVSPNPIDGSPAASNSEIISINNSVGGMTPAGDVRSNYIMTGATWTIPGLPPGPSLTGTQVGTSQLTNSTMETYEQGSSSKFASGGLNCFDCHTSSSPNVFTTGISHVFGALQKLF